MLGNLHLGVAFGMLIVVAPANAQVPGDPNVSGDWSGTYYIADKFTCVTTNTAFTDDHGVFIPAGSNTVSVSCTTVQPWTGHSDGFNFSILVGAGTKTCDDGTATPVPALPAATGGTVYSNGLLPEPAGLYTDTTAAESCYVGYCPAWNIVFSENTMSGIQPCTGYTNAVIQQATATLPTLTQSCTNYGTTSYIGTKNGSGAAITLAPPTLVFPITVTSNITDSTATATAQVSPPAPLMCTIGSTFVFAHARQSSLVTPAKGAVREPKDGTADPCVLAQLNSNSQLAGVSASTMQAYSTGVLTAQSQSVNILNNVPTANVAGASFFVGYGTTASSMLSNGTYQGAVSIPGANSCSTSLLAAVTPNFPSGLSGLWWNPNESGWGVSFTQRRNIIFGAWYTYDMAGKPKWYVASNCALPAGVTGTNGTCSGSLYQVTGPTFFGAPFNPALENVAAAGTLTIAFQDANTAMMSYTVGGQSRTVPIMRQVFQNGTTPPAVDYTDLWWNPNESGWGMSITQQYGVMFLAWYVYDGNGNPVWYVAPDCVVNGSSCTGSIYSTTGPSLGPTFNPSEVQATSVGTITASFLDANNATLTYTISNVTGTKSITRQVF